RPGPAGTRPTRHRAATTATRCRHSHGAPTGPPCPAALSGGRVAGTGAARPTVQTAPSLTVSRCSAAVVEGRCRCAEAWGCGRAGQDAMDGMADPVTMTAARATGGTRAATAAMILRVFGMPMTPSDQLIWTPSQAAAVLDTPSPGRNADLLRGASGTGTARA